LAQVGFTLTELVIVIIIVGVLSALVYAKVDVDSLRAGGTTDKVQAAVRYAHKLAVAQRRGVCVTAAGNDVSLLYWNSIAAACGNAVVEPPGTAAFTVTASGAVTLSSAFYFDSLGRPTLTSGGLAASAITLSVAGAGRSITIEPETGFVH
jgi:MSHA pilin protein MshC